MHLVHVFFRFRVILALSLAGVSFACSSSPPRLYGDINQSNKVLTYSFGDIDGHLVSSQNNRGRVTVLLFVTTFDIASQAQARRLEDLVRTHVPRMNGAAVVIEAPRHIELARAFRDVLDLHYPVAMVDPRILKEDAQFDVVRAVPVWIFVDRGGKISEIFAGPRTPSELDRALAQAEDVSL